MRMPPRRLAFALVGLAAAAPSVLGQQEVAAFVPSDGQTADLFGSAVAIAGSSLAIGSPQDDDFGSSSGAVYVYERPVGGSWTFAAKLAPAPLGPSPQFGFSVAMAPDRLVAGAPDAGNGAALVFERQPGGAWNQVATLLASDGAAGDRFGYAVSIDGDRIVVGSPFDDDLGSASGSAYVFERQTGGAWSEVAKVVAGDGAAEHDFGASVAVAGDRLAAGTALPGSPGGTSAAYVFERQTNGTWSQVAKPYAGQDPPSAERSVSVSLSGDRLAIGVADKSFPVGLPSEARVYERQANGAWTLDATLSPNDPELLDVFASSVAIEGDRVVVGAPKDDDLGVNAGSAYVFDRTGPGTWPQVAKILGSQVTASDMFGEAVGVSNATVVTGAPRWLAAGKQAGGAYVFDPCGGPITPFGAGCSSSATPPHQKLTGCATAGGTLQLRVEAFQPFAMAHAFVGTQPTNLPLGAGCSLLVAPAAGPFGPLSFPTDVSGAIAPEPLTVPVGVAGTFTLQTFLADPAAPNGLAATDAVLIQVQ